MPDDQQRPATLPMLNDLCAQMNRFIDSVHDRFEKSRKLTGMFMKESCEVMRAQEERIERLERIIRENGFHVLVEHEIHRPAPISKTITDAEGKVIGTVREVAEKAG